MFMFVLELKSFSKALTSKMVIMTANYCMEISLMCFNIKLIAIL